MVTLAGKRIQRRLKQKSLRLQEQKGVSVWCEKGPCPARAGARSEQGMVIKKGNTKQRGGGKGLCS